MRNPRALLGAILRRLTARTSQVTASRATREPPPLAVTLEQLPARVPDLTLLSVQVSKAGELRVEGFCRLRGGVSPDEVKIMHAWLRGARGSAGGRVTQGAKSALPNLMSKNSPHDLSESGFVASFDGLDQGSPESYVVRLGVEFDHVCVVARFSKRYERGSAGALRAHSIGQGIYLESAWHAKDGLRLSVVPGQPSLEPGGIRIDSGTCSMSFVAPADFQPTRAQWSNQARGPALRLMPGSGVSLGATVEFDVRALNPKKLKRNPARMEVVDASGSARVLRGAPEHLAATWPIARTGVAIDSDRQGVVRFTTAEAGCDADTVDVVEDGRAIVIRGRYTGPPPRHVTLNGARTEAQGRIETSGTDEFECRLPLHAVGWLGKDRPLPSGDYWVEVAQGDLTLSKLTASRALEHVLPAEASSDSMNVRVERDSVGRLAIDVSPPLDAGEVGAPGRKKVTAPGSRKPIVGDALYLESWFGKSFSDNPAPLADALRGDFKDIYVGVVDRSVEVPDFVKPVIVGSSAWWEVTTTSRVVVNNSWMPSYFKRRAGQKVVQTWHGTPLKKLGFDRSQHEGRASTPKSFAWGSSKWDVLVSPNGYSTEILRRAYTYDGRIAEVGYPRNDVLSAGSGVGDRVRSTLGIGPDETVVVYAPTFREGQYDRSAFCDVEALARKLGSGYRLVVRGHSATLRAGSDHRAANVLDVTTYPESSHILAIADVLVTDYSSVMFDFTATGRPIVFFTPDMDRYSKDGRGVYFDLNAKAPGPVIRQERALADAIRRAWLDRGSESAKYDAWVARFNAYDDGGATERLASIVREWL